MLQHIRDSATGDLLGSVNIGGMNDEEILELLHRKGYLAGGPDYYEITRGYPLAEGKIVILDLEMQTPVLALEDLPESETKAA